MKRLHFAKLHGAGNDFVLIEEFSAPCALNYAEIARQWSDRHCGVGFDQLMLVTRRADGGFGYRIFNADGSAARQCGNGARAVAWWLIHQRGMSAPFELDSPGGLVRVLASTGNQEIGVSLGRPRLSPKLIPLAKEAQATQYHSVVHGHPVQYAALSMGNPHATLLVENVEHASVHELGSALQNHPDFPEQVNVGFCQPLSRSEANLRVFERGVGETLACGSGACAAAVNLIRLGLCDRTIQLNLPGGTLEVSWPSDDAEVELRGPVEHVFSASALCKPAFLADSPNA